METEVIYSQKIHTKENFKEGTLARHYDPILKKCKKKDKLVNISISLVKIIIASWIFTTYSKHIKNHI